MQIRTTMCLLAIRSCGMVWSFGGSLGVIWGLGVLIVGIMGVKSKTKEKGKMFFYQVFDPMVLGSSASGYSAVKLRSMQGQIRFMKETWAFRRSFLDDLKWLGVGPSFIFLLCVGVQVGYFVGFSFAYLFAGSSIWCSDEISFGL